MHRSVLALGVVLLAVLVGLLWRGGGAGVETAASTAERPAPNPSQAPLAAADPASEVDRAQARRIAEPALAPREADRERDLHVLVIGKDAKPIAGASIEVRHGEAHEYQLLDREYRAASRSIVNGTSDARGEFVHALEPARPFSVTAQSPGLAPAHAESCYAGERVTLVLLPAASLFGRVLRMADGAPVADARVQVARREPAGLRLFGAVTTHTDADGRFRLEGLSPGVVEFSVFPKLELVPRPFDLELVPGEALEQNLRLETGLLVRGRVVDALTNAPIGNAVVSARGRSVRTDSAGQYTFSGFGGTLTLEAHAQGYGAQDRQVVTDVRSATERSLDFALTPAKTACGVVLDPDGRPAAGAYVAAAASDYEGNQQRTDWQASTTAADGSFVLHNLRADMRHFLFVRKVGFGSVAYDFPGSEPRDAVIELGTIQLPRSATLHGIVVDEAGLPIPQQPVTLHGSNADRDRLCGSARASEFAIDSYIAERRAKTDDLGRFAFTDLAPGSYRVASAIQEMHDPVSVEVTVGEGAMITGVRLAVHKGLRIAGRIVVGDGKPVPKVYVSVDPQDGQGAATDVEADMHGAFVAEGLAPGRYTLTAYPYPLPDDQAAGRSFASLAVTGIAAGSTGVELRLEPSAMIAGVVRDAEGRAVAAARVKLILNEAEVDACRTDVDGSFRVKCAVGAVVAVVAEPPEGAELRPVRRDSVRPGDGGLTLTLPRR